MNLEQLRLLLVQPEGPQLEFKEWKIKGDADALCRYCCALANEGGGHFILGVTDRRPRKIVGTTAFASLEATVETVRERLRLDVEATALRVSARRVVAFTIPSRPRGVPILYRRVGYGRQGDSLVAMLPERLQAILDELGPDDATGRWT